MTEFTGPMYRDNGWRSEDFTGQVVAVLGSGLDACEIVPRVLISAGRVKVFQETPAWVMPRVPGPLGPAIQGILSSKPTRSIVGRTHLRARISDPWTRRLLTPHSQFATQTCASSNTYFRALQDERCTLVTWPIYAFAPTGVRSAEGVEHRVNSIIVGAHSRFL